MEGLPFSNSPDEGRAAEIAEAGRLVERARSASNEAAMVAGRVRQVIIRGREEVIDLVEAAAARARVALTDAEAAAIGVEKFRGSEVREALAAVREAARRARAAWLEALSVGSRVVPALRIAYDMAIETAAGEQPPPGRPSRKEPSNLRILIGTVGLGVIAGFSTILFLRTPGPVVVFAMGFSWAAAVTALWFVVRRSAGPESAALAREGSRTHLTLISGSPRMIRVAKPATGNPQSGGAMVPRAAKLRR